MKASQVKQICKQAFDELVEALVRGESQQLKEYLKVMGRFHRYSFFNQMLIMTQRKDAQQVAGFGTWKKLGRSVKKGAKGIAIMAPIVYRKKVRPEPESKDGDDSIDLEVVRNFKVCHVFNISDTEGNLLPEFASAHGDPGVYLERLKEFITSKGVTLQTRYLYGTTQGYTSKGMIVLKSGLSPAVACSTLLHELAHQLLHIQQQAKDIDRSGQELEAEAVAFTVGSGIGLDMGTSSSDYISLYNGKKEDLLQSLQRIQSTASEILDAITKERKLEAMVKAA